MELEGQSYIDEMLGALSVRAITTIAVAGAAARDCATGTAIAPCAPSAARSARANPQTSDEESGLTVTCWVFHIGCSVNLS